MSSFHRPDPSLKPINQGEIIGRSSKQRLAKMNVSLHKPRQEYAASRIDYFDAFVGVGKRSFQRANATVFDKNVALEDKVVGVQRDYGCAFYKERCAHNCARNADPNGG